MITLNGYPVVSGVVTFPKRGSWYASVSLGDDIRFPVGTSAVISDGARGFTGRIMSGNSTDTSATYVIHGGSVALERAAISVEWLTPTLRVVLTHLVGALWRSDLSATALPAWAIRAASVRVALDEVCDKLGADWYCLADGRIEVAPTAYLMSPATPRVLGETPAWKEVEYDCEEGFSIQPGYIYDGRKIGFVTYRIGAGIQCYGWVETSIDPIVTGLRGAMSRTARYAHSVGGVVVTASEDAVSVRLDTGETVDSAPISHGMPGARSVARAGCRVWVSWDQADPSRPRVEAYDGDMMTLTLAGGAHGAAREGDAVDCGLLSVSSSGAVTGYTPGSATDAVKAAARAAASAAGGGAFALSGVITGGSVKVKVG